MFIKKLKAQSIIEYTALVIIVSIAVSAMTIYIRRGLSIRNRHLAQELQETNR
ncbi:MAG: hypothetical protein PHP69_04575 [Candidatus Omnitrophica bacterium]|jgi:hypothetical protein|nr:hypothetical protein [Candidatus Omnitrophota bacterium]MDD5081637.1 hypothetical protein [Candidatus Omnitrophota bacterium]MDD5441326.1 hypothetical protein [Candidatus Omnitrophota bacterium]